MRSTTNLAWPVTPFGAGQRPFGKARPMMATVALGWAVHVLKPAWACVVYLNTDSTRVLVLDGQHLNFGFELLTSDETDQPTALAERLDDLLVTCRRKARSLVGHNLAPNLARLSMLAAERRLPGVDAVRQQWTDRATRGRGMARMFDTAYDLGLPGAAELGAACEHAALKAAAIADPVGTNRVETARQALTSTLVIALVAARATGRFDLAAEVDVFATHVQHQLRTAHHQQLLITDKTIVNVLAYARMLLNIEPDTIDAAVLDAMESFCRAWAPTYDLVFLTHDHDNQPSDSFRAKVAGLQHTAAITLRTLYQKLDVAVLDVPLGYETDHRVEWIAGRVAAAGVVLPG